MARITFKVSGQEFDSEVEKALKRVGRGMRIKGYRPGKVPVSFVEKSHGEAVRKDALQYFVQRAYEQAIQEHELNPVGFDRVKAEDLTRDDSGDFSHELQISLRPTIELGECKGLKVEDKTKPVSDEEYEAILADMKRQQSRPEPVGDDGLAEDGIALCKITWVHDEETILEREGLRLSPTSPPPGVNPESFKEGLVGAKDGESFDLDLIVPEDFDQPDHAGKEGTCTVEISQAFRLIEPTQEEICNALRVEDEDQIRPEVEKRIGEAKVREEQARQEEFLIDALIAAHPMELPEPMVENQTQARLAQMGNQMREEGVPTEDIDKHLEGEKETAEAQSRRGMQALFLIQAIADREGLLVDQNDMQTELSTIADRNQTTVDEVKKYYEENRLTDQMALEILERKVRSFLREHADIQAQS